MITLRKLIDNAKMITDMPNEILIANSNEMIEHGVWSGTISDDQDSSDFFEDNEIDVIFIDTDKNFFELKDRTAMARLPYMTCPNRYDVNNYAECFLLVNEIYEVDKLSR